MYRTEIIVPTLASENRAVQLKRAIESIISQGARALVVVNGDRFDPALVESLVNDREIRLIQLEEPGLPNALHVGRCSVEQKYFGILDDDDYLLPGSIEIREGYLEANPEVDVVITNGLREELEGDQRLYYGQDELDLIVRDPLASLMRKNWLTPCGALYRTETVPEHIFYDLSKYAEWTDVAYRLVDEFRYEFLLDETFVQADSPGSLSKDSGQAMYLLKLHKKIMGKARTANQRRLINARICDLHHAIAENESRNGSYSQAWSHHLRSLFWAPAIGVPKYLLFTRRLLVRPPKNTNR